ncbi:AAA family ATPase [Thermotalea metallivorans]|uniref:Septum site-determining protein MinD n=1 Tax=Thermotalea metallivorans TaxID=520762 RepID=A0A140L9Y7_9FIRM|nr:P-loop NTPase [Thermotalea metallivorans]KXG77362.1 Septum site-determining protein MinD [Thermotalea metallivorans]
MKMLIATSNEELGQLLKENVDTYIGCDVDIWELEALEDAVIDADYVLLELCEETEKILKRLSEEGKQVYVVVQSSDVELLKEVLILGGRGLITIENLENEIKEIALAMKNAKPQARTISSRRESLRSVRRENPTISIYEENTRPERPEMRQPQPYPEKPQGKRQTIKMNKVSSDHSRTMPVSFTSLPNGHQIIVVYSPKGGVGKTTIATSIAAHYAQNQNPRMNVALVDLDVDFGNISTKLRIKPSATILDWIENKQLDDLQNYLVDHPSGIKILPAPSNPADEGAVTDIVTQKVLNVLGRRFDLVVVDVGPILRDSTIIACDMATKIYMVATPDLVDLKDVHKAVRCFQDLNIDLVKTKLIINRMPKRAPLRMSEITDFIPLQIATVIPNDDGILIESNRGEIPILGRRTKQFNGGMQKLFEDILPTGSVTRTSANIFGWFKR